MSVALYRISRQAIFVIPEEERLTLHHMFEDNDTDGARQAERICQFLEKQTPGVYLGFLANDSISPPCTAEGHFPCDYYDCLWTTILVSSATWEHYKDACEAREQQWWQQHTCKMIAKEA